MVTQLSGNAIINLYTLVNYYPEEILSKDTTLSKMSGSTIPLINQASDCFANDVGFPLWSGSLQNEYHEGNNDSEIYTNFAIADLDTVHIYDIAYIDYGTGELVSVMSGSNAWDIHYDGVTGRIWTTDGNIFWRDPHDRNNWKVQYHYGYGLPGSGSISEGVEIPTTLIPAHVQSAVCQKVYRLIELRKHSGFESATSAAGISKSFNLNFVPTEYTAAVQRMKRYV